MRTRTLTRWPSRIAAVTVAAGIFTGLAVMSPVASAGTVDNPAAVENAAAGAAVRALTTESASGAVAAVPADFKSVMGYQPTIVDATVVNPHGDCSSPITLPAEFDTACKAHDLGYDLLRYADRSGHPLHQWARRSVDAQLDRRMHTACDSRVGDSSRAGCFAMADIAITAVDANSWRQAYVAPQPELPVKLITEGAFAAGAVAMLGLSLVVALARLKQLPRNRIAMRAASA